MGKFHGADKARFFHETSSREGQLIINLKIVC